MKNNELYCAIIKEIDHFNSLLAFGEWQGRFIIHKPSIETYNYYSLSEDFLMKLCFLDKKTGYYYTDLRNAFFWNKEDGMPIWYAMMSFIYGMVGYQYENHLLDTTNYKKIKY